MSIWLGTDKVKCMEDLLCALENFSDIESDVEHIVRAIHYDKTDGGNVINHYRWLVRCILTLQDELRESNPYT